MFLLCAYCHNVITEFENFIEFNQFFVHKTNCFEKIKEYLNVPLELDVEVGNSWGVL